MIFISASSREQYLKKGLNWNIWSLFAVGLGGDWCWRWTWRLVSTGQSRRNYREVWRSGDDEVKDKGTVSPLSQECLGPVQKCPSNPSTSDLSVWSHQRGRHAGLFLLFFNMLSVQHQGTRHWKLIVCTCRNKENESYTWCGWYILCTLWQEEHRILCRAMASRIV